MAKIRVIFDINGKPTAWIKDYPPGELVDMNPM